MKTITSNRLINFLAIVILCGVSALVLTRTASTEGPKNHGSGTAKEPMRMFDIGFHNHTLSVQPGRETNNHYLGSAALLQAVQSAQLEPRTMVSADFNGDAMGDLVVGYANKGGGVLSLRQGNAQAIAPTGEVFKGITEGRYPEPFLHEATLYALPEAPDFLQVGDFNNDGYVDVLAAARGGVNLYLLAGNGKGTLKAPQRFELSGQLTALESDDFKQPGKFTKLALGVRTAEGPKALVFDNSLSAAPDAYSMSTDVTALAFGKLDDDDIVDVAVATMNQVTVIHSRSDQLTESSANAKATTETEDFPFAIAGLAVGDFMFDRNHQRELAVLSGDGTVHISARGNPDTRPYTKAEKETLLEWRRSYTRDQIDFDTFVARSKELVRANRSAGWNVAQTINTGASPTYTGGGQAVFQRLDATNLPTDDLWIGDRSSNGMKIVKNEQDTARLKIKTAEAQPEPGASSVEGSPLAAVSLRLSVDTRPGRVILRAGQMEPEFMILAPTALYTVNSTADLPDDNITFANAVCHTTANTCTLRAAVQQSNHNGGSNTIMVPDGTYTLTLGPPDDEANTGGALEQSGDLDIFSWNFFNAVTGDTSPILTAVSITGGTRDGCIIQMGTLSPTLATNTPNNKERILQVNDSAVGPGADRVNVTLTNMTMQNAVEPTGSGVFLDGGAVRFDGFDFDTNTNIGLLTLHNVKLLNNVSAGFGGGVFAGFGSLKIESTSIISGNTAQHKVGGGVGWTGGNTVETQTLIIDGSTIGGATVAEGNTASDATFGAGGGIDGRGGAGFSILNGSIIRNNVGNVTTGTIGGGGVQINSPSVVFSNSTISDNKCKSNGGGIFNSARNAVTNAPSTLTMTTMNVTGNQADSDTTGAGDGGGLYNFFGSATIQTTSHVDGNSAVNGGGIFTTWTGIAGDTTAGLTVNTNSTIGQAGAGNGNSARNNGGSIAIVPGAATTFGTINLTSLTFTNNTANSDNAGGGDGGAIFISSGNITSLNNCTIDSNVANSGTGDGIFMAGGTITAAGTLTISGDDSININGGTFTSTAGTFNLAGNFTRAAAGTFTHNSGTLNFNGAGAQSINGTATTDTFNNFTVNKSAGTLTVGGSRTSLTVAATTTLTAGTFAAGTAATITMNGNGGNWTNNGGTFTPGTGIVSFTNTAGAQAINGSAASQTFNSITVNKTAATLSAGGSTTALSLNGTMLLTSGTFAAGTAANINVGVDWTNNGGTFTPGTGLVTFNGGAAQNLNGTAATQTFNNFGVNKGGGTLTVGGSTTTLNVVGTTLTAGTFAAGTAATINSSGDWTNNGGTFTPGTGTVNFNNTAAAQALNGSNASQTFNNVTVAKTAQTLSGAGSLATLTLNGTMLLTSGTFAAGTITSLPIAGNWTNNGATFTPASSTVTFNSTTAAQNLNGTAATHTFNNLTVSKTGQTLTGGGSTTTLTLNGNFSITAGTFAAGTVTTMNVAGNWGNTGTFTPGASNTVILNGNNNTQTLTGSTSFTNLTSNHTGTGGVTATGSTLAVTGLLRIQAGTFTSSSTFANVQIDSGATLASDGSTMNVSGNWTNNGGTFTPSTGTVNFNGNVAQAINGTAASQTFGNFQVSKTGGALTAGGSTTSLTVNDLTMTTGSFTAPATLDINGNTLLTAGILTAGTNITAAGNWTNNGATFTAGAGTVTLDGVATQTIGGTAATTFNNLTNTNAAGITMSFNNTVNGALALTGSDITVQATRTLTQPLAGTSSGNFDVNGRVQRNGFVTGGATLSFGNPFNTIQVTAGTAPANIVVDLARNVPVGFAAAVQRTYTITPSAGGFTGTLRLHYLDSELNSNTEASLILRRFNGTGWAPVAPTSSDTTNNWLEKTGITQFSPWTLSSCCLPTGSSGAISGRITTPDGRPVEGAVVNLGGDQSRKTITDANGNYHFDEVGTGGFYTITPSRANFSFAPFSRSFSQSGNQTEAVFTGDPGSDSANPLDTAEYFVRQQYLDVLGREPEEAGFNYWSDKILACGSDAGCVSSRRRDVAAAFFISDENQASGSFIYDVYAGSLGRKPAFSEFSVDRTQVVGGPALDTEKTTFARNFIQRAEFVSRYQSAVTAETFVDALLQSVQAAGVNLSSERNNLIGIYNQGADQVSSRAGAVKLLADNATFKQSQYNPAFVLTEYFSYLRRDAEPDGFAFWVGVLNTSDVGNYRGMVCSFVTSREYQNRFSQIVSHSNGECAGQ